MLLFLVPSMKAMEKIDDQVFSSRQHECARCGSILPNRSGRREQRSESHAELRSSAVNGCSSCGRNAGTLSRIESPVKRSSSGQLNKKLVDWSQLNDRIEDWFHYADSTGIKSLFLIEEGEESFLTSFPYLPLSCCKEQNVVMSFLKNLKEEDEDERVSKSNSAVKSLEEILDNLKKYY